MADGGHFPAPPAIGGVYSSAFRAAGPDSARWSSLSRARMSPGRTPHEKPQTIPEDGARLRRKWVNRALVLFVVSGSGRACYGPGGDGCGTRKVPFPPVTSRTVRQMDGCPATTPPGRWHRPGATALLRRCPAGADAAGSSRAASKDHTRTTTGPRLIRELPGPWPPGRSPGRTTTGPRMPRIWLARTTATQAPDRRPGRGITGSPIPRPRLTSRSPGRGPLASRLPHPRITRNSGHQAPHRSLNHRTPGPPLIPRSPLALRSPGSRYRISRRRPRVRPDPGLSCRTSGAGGLAAEVITGRRQTERSRSPLRLLSPATCLPAGTYPRQRAIRRPGKPARRNTPSNRQDGTPQPIRPGPEITGHGPRARATQRRMHAMRAPRAR